MTLSVSKKLSLPKEAWIGLLSSLVEAYNMAIFSFTAPFFAKRLFCDATPWSAVFFSYSLVFIGSCFLYPAGAIYFGFLGDKKGRQKTCTRSTLGLGLATGMMGFIPIDLFGAQAWICFLLLICAQHFFSGGEYHGSIVFSLEHAREQKSGFMSSASCLFAVAGIALASGLATQSLMIQNPLWVRGCFLIGGIGGLLSYFFKNHCEETPIFAAIPKELLKTVQPKEFLQNQWRRILGTVLILGFFCISYSFIFIFLPLTREGQTFDTLQSLIIYALFLIAAGILADRFGMQKIMRIGCILFSIAIIPLCYFSTHLLILQMTLTIFACLVIGPIHSWMLNQFEPHERCRGIFISSAIATCLFGGSTVPICLILFEKSHSLAITGIYPLVFSLCALAYLTLAKKKDLNAIFG